MWTKYEKFSAPCSSQQFYLYKLFGCKLNYPINLSFVDLVFIEEKIIIEYDGSGHNLSVQMKITTKEDFEQKEIKRSYALTNDGWRIIRIISKKDFLPMDEVLQNMLDCARAYLNFGHTWIKYCIDEDKVICSLGEFNYNYGCLRKIKKKKRSDNNF
jgi:very-short-patch-repair endonuclease